MNGNATAASGSFAGAIAWSVSRDLRLALRHPDETLLTVAFFALVASLFPLAIGPEPQLLARIGPGIIWVAALLAAFLALPSLFAGDYADGTLEQMVLSPHPSFGWALGKALGKVGPWEGAWESAWEGAWDCAWEDAWEGA